jgi:hypothetical protein
MNVTNPYQPASGTVSGTWYGTIPDYAVYGMFENIGTAQVTVQMVSTPSITSGPRVNLGVPMVIVPAGKITTTFWPNASYVEFSCTAGGPSQLRIQLASHLDWTLEGFAKYPNTYNTPDLTLYPQFIVSGNYPVFGSWAS